jgi:hypothetical protein
MAKLTLVPDQDGYSVKDGQEVIAVKLDGGFSKYRKDLIGAAATIGVQWTLDRSEYDQLRSFYRTTINNGADAFDMDLIFETSTLTQYSVRIVPGSLQLSSLRGMTHIVRAELEVKPLNV